MSMMIRGAGIGAVSALALAAATSAQAITLVAGETELSIYGYAQLNASYDFDEALGPADFAGHGALDFDETGDAEDGFFDMSANQSRFGIATSTPAGGDTLVTKIEGDFINGVFRLRHAYGSWNGILAGQTWSNYNSFVSTAPVIDFNGAVGGAGTQSRNAQIRYTVGGFSVALEELSASIVAPAGSTETFEYKRELPDLSVKYEGGSGAVAFAVGAAVQQLQVADDDIDGDTGFGAFVGGNVELGTGTTLYGNVIYGDGTPVYLSGAPSAFINEDGDIETIEVIGGSVALSQDVGAGSVNLIYGYSKADYDDSYVDAQEERQVVHANYMWSPVTNVTYGVELSWLDATQVDDDSDDAMRAKFMARYSF